MIFSMSFTSPSVKIPVKVLTGYDAYNWQRTHPVNPKKSSFGDTVEGMEPLEIEEE